MMRVVWAQLRFGRGRYVALLLGLLVAVTGFTVLTGSVSSQQTRLNGFVQANSRGAYDILVRPKGSQDAMEQSGGLVRGNFLSGQYGGITTAQWRKIEGLAGVSTAAPIAMLGYVPVNAFSDVDVTAQVNRSLSRQMLKVTGTWVTDQGLTRIPESFDTYVYVTKNPVIWPTWKPVANSNNGDGIVISTAAYSYQGHPVNVNLGPCGYLPTVDAGFGVPVEVLPDGRFDPICTQSVRNGGGPDDSSPNNALLVAQLNPDGTFTTDNLLSGSFGHSSLTTQNPSPNTSARLIAPEAWSLQLMLAAVDPASEDALVGLQNATIKGNTLTGRDTPRTDEDLYNPYTFSLNIGVPVEFSDQAQVDESLDTVVSTMPGVPGQLYNVTPKQWSAELAGMPSTASGTQSATAQSAYANSLLTTNPVLDYQNAPLGLLWDGTVLNPRLEAGQPSYSAGPSGALSAQARGTAPSSIGEGGDVAFRPLTPAVHTINTNNTFAVPVGVFDPGKIKQFPALSSVALETFEPSQACGADARSQALLHGTCLTANGDPGSYVASPPQLLTTLDAVPDILDSKDPLRAKPISEIQVRVSGVDGVNQGSASRIEAVAKEIEQATGLEVDVVAGSSPTGETVLLPAGDFGRPALTLTESWSRKGVAVALVNAVDRRSVTLFVLVLVVCLLFVGNGVSASVRARRTELAVLACVGWKPRRLALLVVTEAASVSATAGVLGAALAWPAGKLFAADVSWGRALIAIPAALLVGVLAALPAARSAGRAHPGAGLAPPVSGARGTGGRTRSIRTLALRGVRQSPMRSLAAVCALAVGVGAVANVVGIETAFHATASGSLLADAVGVQVRAADALAALLALLMAVAAVADALYLSVKERDGELASLRATGWGDEDVRTLILWEGAVLAAVGCAAGALLGAGGTWALTGVASWPVWVALATLAVIVVAVVAAASLIPARAAARRPIARTLAVD